MKLDHYLAAHQISGSDFAAKINCAPSSVSRLRRGETKPDWQTMQAIVKATDGAVTPNDFLNDEGGPKKRRGAAA